MATGIWFGHDGTVAIIKEGESEMDPISTEWTDEDRLKVIANIASRLFKGELESKAAAQTIILVVIKLPDFLEANRTQILKDAGLAE